MKNLKHSKIGITSFILALVVIIFLTIITMRDIMVPIPLTETGQIETSPIVSPITEILTITAL